MSTFLGTQPPEPATNLVGRATSLPVAQPRSVRRHVRTLLGRHRGGFIAVVLLNGVAAIAALVGPQVLGRVVEGVADGTIDRGDVDTLALAFSVAVIVQAAFTRWARLRAGILGEWVLADLREDFLGRAVALPLGTVERAGTGDLVTRVTTDVDRLGWAVRMAIPEMTIAMVTAVLVAAALVFTAPLLALAWLLAVPLIVVSSRWYFRRAPSAYGAELAAYASVNGAVAESVDAGRTVEAYRLGPDRVRMTDNRIRRWISWENYTLSLRTVWFPSVESAYVIPIAAVLLIGGVLAANGTVSLAQVTAAVLYTQMLVEPVDLLLMWFDELQGGQAAMARLLGVHEVPDPETDEAGDPTDASIEAREVRFAYREGHDVLHGVDLDVAPGSRVAVVGPSGAGKSTLGPAAGWDPSAAQRSRRHGWRRARSDAGRASPPPRCAGHPGAPRLRRDVARQPRVGRAGFDRRAAVGSAARGRRRRLGRRSARWVADPGRRRRRPAHTGAGAAGGARAAGAGRPVDAGPRRGDLAARPAGGSAS